ncbi:MAG TPA: tetratricopeptide repeat protein [Terracidiphilus sp.]|jgi:Flp pilus assembly protein TadD
MRLAAAIGLVLLACFLAPQPRLKCQVTGTTKDVQSVSSPYSAEESGKVSSSLSSRESDLRSALNASPNSPEVAYELALVLRQEGKARKSLDMYTRAAGYRKPTTEELRSVALDYVLLNDYDDAIHWLEIAIQMDPKDTGVLYSLGRCYYTKNRFPDAARMYAEVLAIQPHDLKAEENLGLVYDATNEPAKAEAALRTAVGWADANGKDEWPFLDLGGFLLDHNRTTEAVEPLRTATRIKPECAVCHEKLGRALVAEHDLTGGLEALQTATRLEPGNPRTHYELGRALRQAGQVEKAKQELAISQKLYTTHSQE